MSPTAKELLERYIHVINKDNISMLLYLAYRDRYDNTTVMEVRHMLDTAGVCSLEQSKKYAEELFAEAFIESLKLNHITEIDNLRLFLHGNQKIRAALVNQFGLTFDEVRDMLHRDAAKLHLHITSSPHHSRITYRG